MCFGPNSRARIVAQEFLSDAARVMFVANKNVSMPVAPIFDGSGVIFPSCVKAWSSTTQSVYD